MISPNRLVGGTVQKIIPHLRLLLNDFMHLLSLDRQLLDVIGGDSVDDVINNSSNCAEYLLVLQ